MFQQWLEARGLHEHVKRVDGAWQECGLSPRWTFYKLLHPRVAPLPDAEPAWHGTWFYGLWNLILTGGLLESTDRSKGHDY